MFNSQKLLEKKWANALRVVESVKKEALSPEKKGALLHSLENMNKLVSYTEATNPGYCM